MQRNERLAGVFAGGRKKVTEYTCGPMTHHSCIWVISKQTLTQNPSLLCHIWLHLCSAAASFHSFHSNHTVVWKSRSVLYSVESAGEIENQARWLQGWSTVSIEVPADTRGLQLSQKHLSLSTLKCWKWQQPPFQLACYQCCHDEAIRTVNKTCLKLTTQNGHWRVTFSRIKVFLCLF